MLGPLALAYVVIYMKLNNACGGLISTEIHAHSHAHSHMHRRADNLFDIYIYIFVNICVYKTICPYFARANSILQRFIYLLIFIYFVSFFCVLFRCSLWAQFFNSDADLWFTRCQDASQTELSFRVNIFHACRE